MRFARASGETIGAIGTTAGVVVIPFSLAEAYRNYTTERWTTRAGHRRVSPALLGAYYCVKAAHSPGGAARRTPCFDPLAGTMPRPSSVALR